MKTTQFRIPRRVIALLSSIFVSSIQVGSCVPDSLDAPSRRMDARLERKVTFSSSKVYVADLLHRLGRLTDISIRAEERTGASDEILMVNVRNAAIGDVLDAVYSLLSYRSADWHWGRTLTDGAYVYRLTRPLAAQNLPATLRAQLQEQFENDLAAFESTLQLSSEERQRLARKDERIARMLSSERMQEGLHTFFETVPNDARQSVLKGVRRIVVPISTLSERGRSFFKSLWKQANPMQTLPDGMVVPATEPTNIGFSVDRDALTVPNLFIDIDVIGGYNYAGGLPLERSFQDALAKLWMLPGDKAKNPLEAEEIELPDSMKGAVPQALVLQERIRQLSEAGNVSVIARLPRDLRYVTDPGPPDKVNIGEYVRQASLKTRPNLQHKWRGSILLVTNTGWIHEKPVAPWRLAKAVYASKAVAEGRFNLRDLVRIAGEMNEDNLLSLSSDFRILLTLAQWHPLFQFLARNPKVFEEANADTGTPIGPVLPYLRETRPFAHALQGVDLEGARLRIKETDRSGGSIEVMILAPDDRILRGAGFANRPNP